MSSKPCDESLSEDYEDDNSVEQITENELDYQSGLKDSCDSDCNSTSDTSDVASEKETRTKLPSKTDEEQNEEEEEESDDDDDVPSLISELLYKEYKPTPYDFKSTSSKKLTSLQINKKKQQRKIDYENMMLIKKIQSLNSFGLSMRKKQ